MAAQKIHLRSSGTRSACRYSARPSRRLRMLSLQEFADQPLALKCAECEAAFQRTCARIRSAAAETKGSAP